MRWSPAFLSRRSRRWVLIVRSDGARLFRSARRTRARVVEFAADETGRDALREYLERSGPPPLHVLVDIVEEDFRRETVPHVLGLARRTVTKAKRARLCPGTPYASAKREGRLREGRRDDRVLFSAIVRPERLAPWLDTLRGLRIAGVHSLPIVTAGLLPFLGARAGRVLLVTESGGHDLRQTCFEDGRLAMSRLAPLSPIEPSDRAQAIIAEIDRFVHHLARSGHPASGLGIRFVSDSRRLAEIRRADGSGDLADGLVDAAVLARRLGLRVPTHSGATVDEPGGACDRMLARLALCGWLPNHYAPAADLAAHRSIRTAHALRVAGASILLAGTAWGAAAWHRSGEVTDTSASLVREARALEARYRAERPGNATAALRDLRLAVDTAQRLEADRVRALPILRSVSDALSESPVLELDSLEWFEASGRDGWPDTQSKAGGNDRLRIVHVRGRVEPFDGHHRAATQEVFRFADGLASQPRFGDVEVLDVPEPPGWGDHRQEGAVGFEIRMTVNAGID